MGGCRRGYRCERRVARPPVRVVLADDHPVVRDGLAALLSSVPGIEVVATAATGREAVRAAVTEAPDVLVLDVQMPDLNGVEAAAEIARAAPAVAVLMLTMFDDDDSVFAAMRAGARGYLLKGAGQEEIVGAIRAVAAGRGDLRARCRPPDAAASWQVRAGRPSRSRS